MKIFKGKKKGLVYTRNITHKDIWRVFFPKTFRDKYSYLGAVPENKEGKIFLAMEPLVIFMDYKAKPKWCPRWFLRFLHLFGSDNSIVRIRNRRLHNLKYKLTKGYIILDYKTKWTEYDLRISVCGDNQIHKLSESITSRFHNDGYRDDLYREILKLDPNTKMHPGFSTESLENELLKLKEKIKEYE
jgi:hypothetical protein